MPSFFFGTAKMLKKTINQQAVNGVQVLAADSSVECDIAVSCSRHKVLIYRKLHANKSPVLVHFLPLKSLGQHEVFVKGYQIDGSVVDFKEKGVCTTANAEPFGIPTFSMPLLVTQPVRKANGTHLM